MQLNDIFCMIDIYFAELNILTHPIHIGTEILPSFVTYDIFPFVSLEV